MKPTEETTMTETIEFNPFRAWRYDGQKVGYEDVIAPPYDVISAEKQKSLYQLSPYNCIRLILNQEETSDDDSQNRYTRANQFYKKWKEEGILAKDEKPSFYIYRQEYADFSGGKKRSRVAVMGSLKLVPFEKGLVIPHEKTLAGPKKDRLRLMEETHANFSPIFGLFPKSSPQMQDIMSKAMNETPLFEVVDDAGVSHALWAVSEKSEVEVIHNDLASQKIYIADGHHRYTTALNYAEQVRRETGAKDSDVLPSDYTLVSLVYFNDPGLVLEPTHRILIPQDGFDVSKSMTIVKDYFDLKEMSSEDLCAQLKREQEETLKNPNAERSLSFGLLLEDGSSYLAVLKDLEKAKTKMPAGKEDAWYQLDVNLVNYLVLAGLWGFTEDRWEANIRFTHSDQGAVSVIKSHEASAVFVLKAPPVSVLEDMGNIGELMPQKSTYFYPKLASGLLFHHHEA